MLTSIIQASLKNRMLVLLFATLLVISGIYLAGKMDVDVFPDLTAPTVTVMTEAHGMEAVEVERLITFQVETGLNGSPGVRRIRSASAAGFSVVWVEFDWGTDLYTARQIVSEKLPIIQGKLPQHIGEPALAPVSSVMGEILLVALASDTLSPMELRTLADWEILPRIKSINGVANVVVIGGEYKQYQVLASPQKMKYHGVTLEELMEAARKSNINSTGGFYNRYGKQYYVKGEGRVYSVEDIESALVKMKNGMPVKIGDVAEVKIGAADKIGDGSLNARQGVIMTIIKQLETNTIALTDEIDKALKELALSLPEGVEMNTHVFRQSDFIEASINNLKKTLLEGAIFVVIILFLFLMNWRTTFISLLAIPLSLIVTLIVLKLFGFTINTMSLGGMAIAIGILVDDAIIGVENIFRRLRENAVISISKEKKPMTNDRERSDRMTNDSERSKQSVIQIVFEASMEIRSSIVIATFIIIVSFIPLFFLSGMEGRLLQPLGIAFLTSVLTSLVVAVTVTPALSSYLLGREKTLLRHSQGTFIERFLRKHYQRALKKALQFPKSIIGITVMMFILSIVFLFGLGRGFLPEFNEGSLALSVIGPPGMSLEESNKTGKMIEELLLEFPEIDVVTRRTGRAELDEHAQGSNGSEVDAPFTLKDLSKEEFLKEVRKKLSIVPGVNIIIGQPIAHRIDHMLSGTRANIAIKIFGEDLNKMFGIGNQIRTQIVDIEGLVDVAVEQQVDVPQIKIKPKRELLAKHGLTIHDLTEFVDVAFGGEAVSQVYEGQRSFDMIVRFNEKNRGSIEKIKEALIDIPNGEKINLEQVALIQSVSSPNTISRENVQRKVVVSANVSGRDLRGVVTEIQDKLSDITRNLPTGYRIDYGGQFESEEKASKLLLLASILAVIVIFILLFYEFRNFKLAGIVLLNLPLALIGGIFIVYFTSGIISIASTIGFISLFGIATRNGILLISRYQALKEQGREKTEAIIKGSLDRLNPILMTALTTALALIPLALAGNEAGSEIQSPMAIVILGGLLSATFLNVFVIPCVYSLVEKGE